MKHKIILTELQAQKIIEALKEKFSSTHDATWLGLQHNLESQIYYIEQKKPYVLAWMEREFNPIENVIDPFDRVYVANPVPVQMDKIKPSFKTQRENVGGIEIIYEEGSPTYLTKSYPIYYQILKPKN